MRAGSVVIGKYARGRGGNETARVGGSEKLSLVAALGIAGQDLPRHAVVARLERGVMTEQFVLGGEHQVAVAEQLFEATRDVGIAGSRFAQRPRAFGLGADEQRA